MPSKYLFLLIVLFGCAGSYGQDLPLRVIEQPKPALPPDYGTLCTPGTLRFRASGEIGKIVPVSRMPVNNLTDLAIGAAKRIEFLPEIRGGQPLSTFQTVGYRYDPAFGGWTIPKKLAARTSRSQGADSKAEAVLQKAVQNLGGDKYLKVTSQVGRGKFSLMKEGAVVSFQSFIDVIVFPDKERTEFKGGGVKSIQTNAGNSGWTFDGDAEVVKVQDEKQIDNFKRAIRTSLDNLLRGQWRNDAKLSYVGKRQATLGKRNEVVKLTYNDGLAVEFEFAADDGLPAKALYGRTTADGEDIKEEDRYAQFIDVGGIRAPFIVDRFTNGIHSSRINYESIEYNRQIPDSIFMKPANPKELKKDLKF